MHKTYGNGLLRPLKFRLSKRARQRREARMWRRYLSSGLYHETLQKELLAQIEEV